MLWSSGLLQLELRLSGFDKERNQVGDLLESHLCRNWATSIPASRIATDCWTLVYYLSHFYPPTPLLD